MEWKVWCVKYFVLSDIVLPKWQNGPSIPDMRARGCAAAKGSDYVFLIGKRVWNNVNNMLFDEVKLEKSSYVCKKELFLSKLPALIVALESYYRSYLPNSTQTWFNNWASFEE